MSKKRIANYVFFPGVSSASNALPDAYALLKANKVFIQKEANAWINTQIAADTAQNIYPNAVALLTANKQFILDEISAWTTYQVTNNIGVFNGYTYGATEIAKCKRDMGYLIDALIYDIRYGGNERVSFVASQYYLSGVVQLINVPVEVLIQAQLWNLISVYILPKVAYSTQQSPVTSTQTTSGTIAETGARTQTTTLSTIVSNVMSGGLSTIPTTIYSAYNFPGYTYDASKCERDVGYIIDAYLNDLRYGGNARTRLITSRYWDGQIPQVDGDRKPEIATHTFIRDLINNVIFQGDYTVKCQRDIGYLLDGVRWDVALGTNYNQVFLGLTEVNSVDISPIVLTVIQNAGTAVAALPAVANSTTALARANAFFTEVLDITANGRSHANALTFTNPTTATTSQIAAKDKLVANAAFIAAEVNAWVALTYPTANHDSSKCSRDITYAINAICYDILYGCNQATYDQAKFFFYGFADGSAGITSAHTAVTIAAYGYFKSIIDNIVQGQLITPTTTGANPNALDQITIGNNASPADATICQNLAQITADVISAGSQSAALTYLAGITKTYPDVTWATTALQSAKTAIESAKSTIIASVVYTPLQNSYPRELVGGRVAEAGAPAVITYLAGITVTVIQNGLSSLPALVNGVSTIKIQGQYTLDKLLLITNSSENQIIYNFSDPLLGAFATFDSSYNSNGNNKDADYPSFLQVSDYVTTLTLVADTSTSSASDDIQIFVEAEEQKTRPYDFGTDAIERMRVAAPQSMLDADFEYGLQPTKWQAIGVARGYPSVYEIPGTDTSVLTVTTDASAGTSGVGESLITVTTAGAHGFSAGTPITIRSLANTISGFSRAEGTFIIISVPSPTTFTYYATSKVGTSNGQVLATTYTQLRKGAFYTGASIGTPTFSVYSNGSNGTFQTKFITTSGTDQIAVAGVLPALGVPISGTGINSGTQISGTVGPGGLAVTASIGTPVAIGDTTINVVDPTGILEGMAIDNGSGTSVFVSNIIGNNITVTQPVTTARSGNIQTYLNNAGVGVPAAGTGARFSVDRQMGVYSNLQISNGGTNYVLNTTITIAGTALGGVSPANDLTIKITGVALGVINSVAIISGTSVSGERSYTNLLQSNTSGLGSAATFNVATLMGAYVVSIVNTGGGYAFNDTITILGSRLGGVDVTNDLIITVTSASIGPGSIVTFSFSGIAASTDTTFTNLPGTTTPTGLGATFDVIRSAGIYSTVSVNLPGQKYAVNDVITIAGTVFGGVSTTNDLTITVTGVDVTGAITSVSFAGTAITGSTIDFWSAVALSDVTTAQLSDGTVVTTSAIATVQITFTSPHGLVPGSNLLVDITSAGTNHALAKGPFYVESVPAPTIIRYTARTTGAIDTNTAIVGTVYARPDSYFIHRPFDGGVQLGTGGPQHGAQAIRMSKKYIRYQSGKGIMYTTGALFAPSYNLQSATATGTAVGSYITFTTDDVDHGCQVGGVIEINGVNTSGYNGTFTIVDVITERIFRVQATTVLGNLTASITTAAQMSILTWHGATVRAGTFDDQNGMFWQYNGNTLAVGRRSSTLQLSGVASIIINTNVLTGTNTRFRDQVKAGDRIVIKGMTHVVTNVQSQTQLSVTPDYRGTNSAISAKVCLVQDLIVPQSQFNLDKLDGTGPSGYNLDITKMQMIGMQWSWYGAGFIDFMLRGSDGNYVFAHRMRNSNVNTEAYMRTGNMPVRYEVINESATGKLLNSVTATQTTLPLTDASQFPNEAGIVYVDNELIAFSGKSGNTLIGCTRASPMVNFVGGAQRTFRAASATTHELNTGVILISNTITPIISHWGSAFLTDGRFDDDRGYLFNYASTGIQASTTKQTAFLIRLAPSVSNAIIGDLGDRELINRAQLLLKAIEVTSDTGTGGLVVEGVLNPQNYPTDPTAITWSGLAGSSAGGQPSFAQVAPGGSVSWSGGASVTTSTATTTAALTGNATVPNNALFASASGSNILYVTKSSWDTLGASAGFSVAASETKYPSGTTISSITTNPDPIATTLGLITGTATVPNNVGFNVAANNNYVYFTQASWQALNAGVGSAVYSNDFPAGTTVTSITGPAVAYTLSYYQVFFSANSLAAHNALSTVTFFVTGAASSGVSSLNFTQSSWAGLPIGSGVATNTTNDTGKFAIGTQISAVSALKTFAGVNYYTVTFNTNLLTTLAPSVTLTLSYTAYYTILLSKAASSTISAAATVAFTPAVIATNTSFLYFTQATWEALVAGYGVTTGTEIVDVAKFPSGTKVSSIGTLSSFGGTSYYRVNFTQSSITAIAPASTVTFQFGLPPYAQPGETVFSFIAAPGTTSALDLTDLKELTNTTLGGRGTYPNGPDVLAINVYRASGTGSIPTNVIVRWGEAQA